MLAAVGGDGWDVEDVAQEAFILARRRWVDLRHYQKPEAWVMKVALQLLRRWRARERRLEARTSAAAESVFDPFAVDSSVSEIYRAVQRLPRRRAEVIVLHLLGYSIAEMAEILAILPGTVKSHLCLARRDLRMLLGEDQEATHDA